MSFLNRIVVGEDEDAVAHLIEATLGDAGFLCLRGKNGEEVLELARAHAPDLIVLDVLMPKLDGFDTVRQLKADPVRSKIPVLMLTSLAAVDDRVRGLEAGADDYLSKPFDLRELVARVRALVRASRRERDRSPTTDLPGPGSFEQALEARLAAGGEFGVLLVEVSEYERTVVKEGWKRGNDLAVAATGALRGVVGESVLLAHLGGGAFAMVGPAGDIATLEEAAPRALGLLDAPIAARVAQVIAKPGHTVATLSRALAKARD